MAIPNALTSVSLADGQSPGDFILANSHAAAGAKKNLTPAPSKCASGNCENTKHKYKTKQDAAKAALDSVNDKSISENKEYAGQIYRNPDGTYGYTDPVAGSGDESHPSDSPVPDGTQTVGNYHTHGDYSVNTDQGLTRASSIPGVSDPASLDREADNFSQPDLKQYEQQSQKYPGFTGYLGTPSGSMRAFDQSTGLNLYVAPLK